jgi:hypothetical protein
LLPVEYHAAVKKSKAVSHVPVRWELVPLKWLRENGDF